MCNRNNGHVPYRLSFTFKKAFLNENLHQAFARCCEMSLNENINKVIQKLVLSKCICLDYITECNIAYIVTVNVCKWFAQRTDSESICVHL
jgi:hypothetical protein